MIDLTRTQLAQVRAILAAHLPPDVTVQVFGSRARGRAKPFSDLDLLLSGAAPVDPVMLGRLADAFEESNLPWRVDLVDRQALSPAFQAAIAAELVALP